MSNKLLKVDDLAICFGPVQAVKWVSFSLEHGRTLGIVGESGSGKSTLLWSLTRLLPDAATLNSGEVWFNDVDLLRQPPDKLRALRGTRISYISQDPMTSLAPNLTIGQQMTDLLYREPWSKQEKWQRAIDALDWVSLPEPAARMKMYPHELSGGQRQRVSIAMALILGPDLVLADEPTTALDPTLEVEILELLRRLQRETGCSIIFVTHHLGVVASLCDDVLVMKDGEIREAGPVVDVFANPQDEYTQKLLRCDPAQIEHPTRRLPTMIDVLDGPVKTVAGPTDRIDHHGEPVLAVDGLTVTFTRKGILPVALGGWAEDIHAVSDVSFDIKRGETLALIGESGSGKTTVARSIMGLVRPDAGEIVLSGKDMTGTDAAGWRDARSKIAMMFQDPAGSLSPRVSIVEQVVEPLIVHNRKAEATRGRALELLLQVGLDASFADRYPHELSGGQARRAGIARALALSPELIIADEPTAGLDVSIQGEVVNLLNALQEQMGLSILLITHNMSVVRHASDRMVVMLKGKLVETGPTDLVFAKPFETYTPRVDCIFASRTSINKKAQKMSATDTTITDNQDLCYMSAREQLELFRSGKLSPVEVLQAQFARADVVEPKINAFTVTFQKQALKAAKAAEDIYHNRPEEARPLEGITVAIKDEMSVKGQPNTQGSLIYKDYIADDTHPVAQRLSDAGAIFHARSATPEFCCAWTTESKLHGITRNPWGLEYTPSGSSGGSGAALAAGTTTLATGSDIGGSIRGPAGACGIVGYKPPYGRVPDVAPFNLDPYCHVGSMSRTTADCALMQNVISGHHPQDIATVRENMILPLDYADLKGKRIAYTLDVSNEVVTDDVAAQTMKVLDVLSHNGAIIEEVKLGWGKEVREACSNYLNHLMGTALLREVEEYPELVCDYTAYCAKNAKITTADEFLTAYDVAADIYSRFGPLMEEYYAFICPTFASHEMFAQQKPWDRITVQGRDFDSDYDLNTQAVFNMLSRLPVLAVPAGLGSNGRPVGVQIVARAFDDTRVFHVASVLEKSMPWLDTAERRPVL